MYSMGEITKKRKRFELDVIERLTCEVISENIVACPRFVLQMDHKIDKDALHSAANRAATYHPYFKTRLIEEDGIFYWEENEFPIVIKKQDFAHGARGKFGNCENNFYPWLITYFDDCISFDFSHQLVDGGGACAFIATVMEYYIRELEHDPSELEGFTMSAERLEAECALPSQSPLEDGLEAFYFPKAIESTPFRKDSMHKNQSKREATVISVDRESVKNAAFRLETTQFAVIGPILSKAALPYLEDGAPKIVKLTIPCSLRAMFNSTTFHNFVFSTEHYYFEDKMKHLSQEVVAMAFRSRMDIWTTKENVQQSILHLKEATHLINIPEARAQMKASFDKSTLEKTSIIYTHMTKTGLSDRVNAHLIKYFPLGASPLDNVLCVGVNDPRHINLLLSTHFVDGKYVERVLAQLDELGFSYEVTNYPDAGKNVFVFESI